MSWRLPASGLCGLKGQALAGDLAGLEVGIGGELEQHRLEGLVVDLAGCGQVALLHIGVVDGADKVFNPQRSATEHSMVSGAFWMTGAPVSPGAYANTADLFVWAPLTEPT